MGEGKDLPVQEIKEILEVVSDKVPHLINQLKATLYSEEAGKELGKAVGSFYKELVDSGIPKEEALAMAKSYIASLQGVLKHGNVHFGQGE